MKRTIMVGVCGWFVAGMVTAAVPPPERLLPADSWLVLTIPDLSQARAQSEEWPIAKLFGDPAMRPFNDRFMGKWTAEVVGPLEREFGVTFKQLKELAQGQVTLALTTTGLDEEEPNPGWLLILDSRTRSEALGSLLLDLRKRWRDAGKKVRTISLRGVEFTGLTFDPKELGRTLEKALPGLGNEAGDEPAPDQPGEEGAKEVEWIIGQAESLLLVGNQAVDLEKVLSRLQGGSAPVLAEQEYFAANYPLLLRDSLGYAWLDVGAIVQRLLKMGGEEGVPSPLGALNPAKLMESLGLLGLQTVSVALHDEAEGGLLDVLVNVPASKRKGLFNLLKFEPLDADPPAFVPEQVTSFRRFRLNWQEMWKEAEKMLGEFNPQFAEMVKIMVDSVGQDQDPPFSFRQNLLGNLGNDIITYEKAPRENTPEAWADLPSLYLVGSPQPEQLAGALTGLMPLLQLPAAPKQREFLGRTVYTVDIPQSEGTPRRVHFSPSGGYLALSLDEATLEEFLRVSGNPGRGLREKEELARAAQKVGGMSTGLFGYEDRRQTMRAVIETLRKSGSPSTLLSGANLAGVEDEQIKEWIDFSLLPPYERIAKYFFIEVFSGQVTPEGFRFKRYLPNAPGTN